MTSRTAVSCMLLFALAACGDAAERDSAEGARSAPSAAPAVASSEVATTYAPELNVDLARMTRLPSGLHYEDLQQGTGDVVEAGQRVLVHYTGWLPDGTVFDSSREVGRTAYDLDVGAGDVIAGWDEGLLGMRVGGQRRLVLPPSLAYGTEGRSGVIPPNATLVFDVEVVEIQ